METNMQNTEKHPALDLRVEINIICLHSWFVSRCVGVPAVNLELLDPGLRSWSSCGLSISHHLHHSDKQQMRHNYGFLYVLSLQIYPLFGIVPGAFSYTE